MTHKPAAIVWEITLFGGLAVHDGNGRAVEVPGRKDRALLGFLAAAPGIPHLRERLAALLWGDSGERQARDSLKQATGLAIDAALAGQGVVLADLFLIADELRAGRLMKLCDLAVPDWNYYLVHRNGARHRRAVDRFRDWLLRDTEPLRRNGFKFSLQG